MTIKSATAAVLFAACLVGQPTFALDDDVVFSSVHASLEAIAGRALTEDEISRLTRETEAALQRDRPAVLSHLVVLGETTIAMGKTKNPAAHGIMYDTLRQLIHLIYLDDTSVAMTLYAPNDKMVGSHAPGVGVTYSDLYAGALMKALNEGRFDHPEAVKITQDDLAAYVETAMAEYAALDAPNQQVYGRFNAWYAGIRVNWHTMNDEERQIATAFGTDTPTDAVVEKVTGAQDLIGWVAGMEIGIRPELVEEYPEMARFHAEGHTGEAMAEYIAVMGLAGMAVLSSEFQSLQMLYNMNNYGFPSLGVP